MGNRKRSIGFDDEMNEAASKMPSQIVTAWATAPAILHGEKSDGTEGLEQFIELTTFGQVLNPDGSSAVDDDGGPMVSMTRVLIPIERTELVIDNLRVAKLAIGRVNGVSHDIHNTEKGEDDGTGSPPDRH